MHSILHLRVVRAIRIASLGIGLGVASLAFFSGTGGELDLAEAWPLLAGILIAKVVPAVAEQGLQARCRDCGEKLILKKGRRTIPGKSGRAPSDLVGEHRYWCTSCQTAETYPATCIDNLLVFSNSASSNSAEPTSPGE